LTGASSPLHHVAPNPRDHAPAADLLRLTFKAFKGGERWAPGDTARDHNGRPTNPAGSRAYAFGIETALCIVQREKRIPFTAGVVAARVLRGVVGAFIWDGRDMAAWETREGRTFEDVAAAFRAAVEILSATAGEEHAAA
jgi:hypothetical protein